MWGVILPLLRKSYIEQYQRYLTYFLMIKMLRKIVSKLYVVIGKKIKGNFDKL